MTANAQNQVDEIVLVVHGVGDPQPGETLSLFARSIAERHQPLTEYQEQLWLANSNHDDRDIHTFATHVRHLEFDESRATLAEVYWADLSRVSRGTLGILWGLIQLIFGLRYVAFVAGHQHGLAANMLQSLGLISSRILHGPVLAVNFVLAAMMLIVVGTEALWPGSSMVIHWTNWMVMGCVGICLLASLVGRRLTKNLMIRRFWFWVVIAAMFMLGLMAINLTTQNDFPLLRYCRVMILLMGAQWMSLVVVLIAMFACWALASTNKKLHRPGLHAALVLPAVAVGFWGLALPIVWMLGAKTLNRTVAIPDRFDMLFDEAVPLLGLQLLMAILLAGLFIVQLARYVRSSERITVHDFINGRRAPRLIVNGSVQFLAGKCAVVGIGLMIYLAALEVLGHRYHEYWLGSVLAEANKYALGLLVPIGGLLFLSMHCLRSGLDIMLDAVNHFYFRPATANEHSERSETAFDIIEVTFDGGRMYFSRRDAIHRRMKRILEYFRDHSADRPNLTIVSHSQGSLIAIEVMNDAELGWLKQKFGQINLVTMGSPFHHIYQKYFRHFYPRLDDAHWDFLRSRVSRWVNIFRVDDFVGTDIEFPDSLPQVQNGNYSNQPVERGGHQFYWRDRQVLSIIREQKICRSLSPDCGRPAKKDAA